MRPLVVIGYGLLLVALQLRLGSYDVLVDPLGWLLVLWGLRRLTTSVDLPLAMVLGYLGVLALLCSGPLWWPSTARSLDHGEPSVLWAVGLGELLFQAVLCHALATRARGARDGTAVAWFRIGEAGVVIGAVAPVLYFGAGLDWVRTVGDFGQLLQLLVLVLCFAYSGRPWAGAPPRPAVPAPAAGDTGE